ncbi:beta-ketoacyl-[acyl-carrier-protein] synthase family protein [Deltaproteobacteria bacterium TL4]
MRVVVTGMGVISSLGHCLEDYWQGLTEGRSGMSPSQHLDVSESHFQEAGLVTGFEPEAFFNKKEVKALDRFSQLGIVAAEEAWEKANLITENDAEDPTAVIIGTGIGGISSYQEAHSRLYGSEQEKRLDAYTIPKIMHNAVAAHMAIRLGLKGRNITVNTACSSGANAIGQAYELIHHGIISRALCGGAEAPVTYELLKAWGAMGVLARAKEELPAQCRPFDKNRNGFILGEGAGMVVLESLSSAQKRNAPIYGELIGYSSNCDAYHLTLPSEQGIINALRHALKTSEVKPFEVDYINAHGTGTKANDCLETRAIHSVFEEEATHLHVSSNKSMLGHTMGASSALEFIATIQATKYDLIPPTINYTTPDPECDLNYVPNQALKKIVTIALSNSFAFGGSNAVLVVKKWNL